MNDFLKRIAVQVTSILLAAMAAAAMAFAQSVVTQTSGSGGPELDPSDTGLLGGALKAGHFGYLKARGRLNL